MKAPVTDKTLGVSHLHQWSDDKFRDVRKRARDEEIMRRKKAKKDKQVKVPKFHIGDVLVLTDGFKEKHFHLVDVIDIDLGNSWRGFEYYAILKKTTDTELVPRIGRLVHFGEGNWWGSNLHPANVENRNIRWSAVSVE